MISYEIDPSLHTCEPEDVSLDDGFSRPQHGDAAPAEKLTDTDARLLEKSDF